MDWKTAKKQLLKNNWKLRVRYYLGKPGYWLESRKLRKVIKTTTGTTAVTFNSSAKF